MINLYIDFDGVIVDTINETYKMIEKLKINLNDSEKVINFYKELDWDKLLSNTKKLIMHLIILKNYKIVVYIILVYYQQ